MASPSTTTRRPDHWEEILQSQQSNFWKCNVCFSLVANHNYKCLACETPAPFPLSAEQQHQQQQEQEQRQQQRQQLAATFLTINNRTRQREEDNEDEETTNRRVRPALLEDSHWVPPSSTEVNVTSKGENGNVASTIGSNSALQRTEPQCFYLFLFGATDQRSIASTIRGKAGVVRLIREYVTVPLRVSTAHHFVDRWQCNVCSSHNAEILKRCAACLAERPVRARQGTVEGTEGVAAAQGNDNASVTEQAN